VNSGHPPAILQIVREPLKPDSDAAYAAVEEELAIISASLGCPHPYLGAESLTGPKEVWWFNGYESEADKTQVYDAYAKNTRLLEALQQSSQAKTRLTLPPIEAFANYRADVSTGRPWSPGVGRFLVITTAKSHRTVPGTVFEAPDGTRYVVTPAHTHEEADAAHKRAAADTNVFAVRPSWSFPATEWIEADPLFWRSTLIGVTQNSNLKTQSDVS
jgi:hypothetical protein